MNPETCAHCRSALALTQHAFENKLPPPECVRDALLLGLVVGAQRGLSADVIGGCPQCRHHLEQLRATLFPSAANETSLPPSPPASPSPPSPQPAATPTTPSSETADKKQTDS